MTENPWAVENLDVYLFYCCPKCEHKSKTTSLFLDHAHSCHPESKDTLKPIPFKIEITEDSKEVKDSKEDIAIKEETLDEEGDTSFDNFEASLECFDEQEENTDEFLSFYEEEESLSKRKRKSVRYEEYGDEEEEEELWELEEPKKTKKRGRPKQSSQKGNF